MSIAFKFITLILIVVYGGISIFACAMAIRQSRDGIFPNIIMIVGSIVILFASITEFGGGNDMLYVLLVGLILIHIAAIIHGYKLFNQLNLKHHVLRGCISIIILICYYVGFLS
ncbi:hypothetical protein [Clostridium sp.]|uniref:hypothetical protein n=1 Tax=Clostridium sp. TaxID=1506 RepID=UPI0034640198